jgi:hypothetical protein
MNTATEIAASDRAGDSTVHVEEHENGKTVKNRKKNKKV